MSAPGFVRHEHGVWCHPSANDCWKRMQAPPLTEQEAATVARFHAAPDADESLRVRLAIAMCEADGEIFGHTWDAISSSERGDYYRLADAAIAVVCTPVEATPPLCATCRHLRADHGVDRNGRVICWGASCGCGEFVAGGAA